MRKFLALLLFVLNLNACDSDPSRTTRTSVVRDGTTLDASKVQTWATRATFDCLASVSGSCQIVVFTSNCPAPACSTKVIRELSLPKGSTRELRDLPTGFQFCLAHDAKPVAPACRFAKA